MTAEIQVSVKKTEPATVAFISCKGPYTQMNEVFAKLFGRMGKEGLAPAGPPQGVYFNTPGEVPPGELLWEIRCPIAGDVAQKSPDAEGFGIKKVESAEVAATIHKGPFGEVGQTYGVLASWIGENGYQIAGPSQEVYLSEPGKTSPQELITEVRFPVKKK